MPPRPKLSEEFTAADAESLSVSPKLSPVERQIACGSLTILSISSQGSLSFAAAHVKGNRFTQSNKSWHSLSLSRWMPHGRGERHPSFPCASSLFSRAWRPRFRHFPCRKRSNPLVDAWMQIPLHPADGTILAVGIVVAFLKSGEIHLQPAALEFH